MKRSNIRSKRRKSRKSRKTRKTRKSLKLKKSFGIPIKIPSVVDYSNKTRVGVVGGSLALRKLYLDDPAYGNLKESVINGIVKKIRDDTAIKSIVKFSVDNGYSNITEKSVRKLYKYWNIAGEISDDLGGSQEFKKAGIN
jgi:hypothetical protein